VVLVALMQACLLIPAAFVAGLAERGKTAPPLKIPLGNIAGGLLLLATLVALVASRAPLFVLGRDLPLLDLVGTLPLVLVTLAIWTQSERPAVQQQARKDEVVLATSVRLDVPALWKRLGALEPNAKPFATNPGAAAEPTGGWAASIWRHAGALGPPPRALEEIASAWAAPGAGWLVGDLPDSTERFFVVSSVLLAIRRDGLPSLVVTRSRSRS